MNGSISIFENAILRFTANIQLQRHQKHADCLAPPGIVLGDGAVGKTSLIMRFCEDSFQQSYKQPTPRSHSMDWSAN